MGKNGKGLCLKPIAQLEYYPLHMKPCLLTWYTYKNTNPRQHDVLGILLRGMVKKLEALF